MATFENHVKDVFDQALEIMSSDKRRAWLESRCADDPRLLRKVYGLLTAHEDAGSFLQKPLPSVEWNPISEQVGSTVGPYKLREQIGEGGMGVVYVAEQTRPVRRKVALKLIKPGMDTKQVIARFEAERQALALMDHPNIAHVIDGGTTETERPFFVMELVRGLPVTRYCDEHQLTMRQRLELFVTVCRAVQHAQQKGIIHRDIKPSNVLVTRIDGEPVPKVIDFGVAKAVNQQLTEQTVYTQFAEMIGTPAYMSPEQAELSSVDVDTRSDVYSLGVLLYELLTGCTPFDRELLKRANPIEKLRMIREDEPRKPSARLSTLRAGELTTISERRRTDTKRMSDSVAGELDWIVMRAMEKDRNRRYESASAFAADIERYLGNEPVEACPPSAWYRFRKFAARNKGLIGTCIVISAAVLIGAGISIWQTIEANDARRLADNRFDKMNEARALAVEAEEAAERNAAYSRQLVYVTNIALAARARRDGDVRRFTDLLDRHIPKGGSTDLRGFEWRYLRQFARAEYRTIAQGTGGSIVARFSRDGRYIASGRHDGTIHLWDGRNEKHLFTLSGHRDLVRCLDIAPDGNTLASIGDDGIIRLWDLDQRKLIRKIHAYKGVHGYGVHFALRGKILISIGESNEIAIWDPKDARKLGSLDRLSAEIECIDVSPDGRSCVASDGKEFIAWDLESRKRMFRLTREPALTCIRYSLDGKLIAGGTRDLRVCVWSANTGRTLAVFERHESKIQDLAFGPSDRLLASSDKAGIVRFWSLNHSAKELKLNTVPQPPPFRQWPSFFRAHDARAWTVDFSPDGKRLVTASKDGTIKSWPVQKRRPAKLTITDTHDCDAVSFTADGKSLFIARDWQLEVWNDTSEKTRQLVQRYSAEANWMAHCRKNGLIATGHQDGKVRLWNSSGKLRTTIEAHKQSIRRVALSIDGRLLATASDDGFAKLWNAVSEKQMAEFRMGHTCENVAFSPNGNLLAGCWGDNVFVFDTQSHKQVHLLKGHQNTVECVVFSPDGHLLATVSHDRTIRIWNVETGRRLHVIAAHRSEVSSVVFSPDGGTIVSGDIAGQITFSHVATGQLLFNETIAKDTVSQLVFSPDGNTLAVSARRIGVILLNAPPIETNRKPLSR
ncbi:MAG: protein kinase [Planctomycetaceae bacterium]